MNVKNIIKVVIASIILKIAYLVFAFFVIGNSSVFSADGYRGMIHRNDTGWFEKIATNWYPTITDKKDLGYNNGPDFKQSEWAFFPLYPELNRITMKWLNIDFRMSAFFWSLLFSTLSFIGFYLFCELYLNDSKRAFYYSLVFLLLPFHYYLSMMYTEALFFTFLIYSFIAIYFRKYWLLSLLIVPLALVRPNGIIVLIPLYLYFLERNGIISKKHIDFRSLFSIKNILQSLFFLSGPIAFLLYCLYQMKMTGFFFAFSIAQVGWYREFMFPLFSLFRGSDFITQFNSFYTVGAILLSLVIWRKFPLSLNVYIWISLLLPLCSGSVTSMPRFISLIFPFSIIVGYWLYSVRFKFYYLGIIFSLQLLVFYYWLTWSPFSF